MDGIVLIDKEKNLTSRDVVNLVCKKLHTKKVGHTGTLDPIATGLMVLCVNEGCKLVSLLQNHDKDYIAKVKLGIKTDTFDITGKMIDKQEDYLINKEILNKTLNSFIGEYHQTVPIYSSIKVNGKKLYEYARNNEEVLLPKHLVKIYDIKLLELNKDSFSFYASVSKGTYIRSLINDISEKMGIYMTMEELQRVRVGDYKLEDASNIDNLVIIPLIDALKIKKVEVSGDLLKKVSNGVKIDNIYNTDFVMFTNMGKVISIYQEIENKKMKSYRTFNHTVC